MKQKKKGQICIVIYSAGKRFFFNLSCDCEAKKDKRSANNYCLIQVREREFFIQIICREQRLFRAPDVLNPLFLFRCPVLSQPNTIIISLACTHAGGTLTHQESREIDSDRQRAHQMLKRMEVCLSCSPPPPEHLNDSRSSQRLCA